MRTVLITAALLAAGIDGSASAQIAAPPLASGETLLSVQAGAEAAARPDRMAITAGVVTTGATASAALDENNRLVAARIDALRGLGIGSENLKTIELQVRPRFARGGSRGDDEDTAQITGFVARNSLDITLRDLNRAGAIISTLFERGANSVQGPRFTITDDINIRRAAERAAITSARAEADNYAAALGMRVARVLRVADHRQEGPSYSREIIVTGTRVRPTPIEPGEVKVEASVIVDFALVPR